MLQRYRTAEVLALVVALSGGACTAGSAFAAQSKTDVPKLPAPYISRAIEAVVIPINGAVRKSFKLSKKDRGVLVVSVAPTGIAAKNGIKAGDILQSVQGYQIKKPADLDSVVYYWTGKDKSDFSFNVGSGGTYTLHKWPITRADYIEVIDISAVSSWSSWSSASYSFSYSEYYAEYSAEMSASYESSEASVEQEASSESFSEEASSDAADANNDGTPDGMDEADGADQDVADSGDESDDQSADSGDDGNDDADDGGDDGSDDGGDE